MSSVQFSVSHEGVHEVEEFCHKHECSGMLVEKCGPDGGNPLVEFTGSRENLESLVREWFGSRADHVLARITD